MMLGTLRACRLAVSHGHAAEALAECKRGEECA